MNMNIFKALFKDNKGQFNVLATAGIGLIIFAVVVVVGSVIMGQIGANTSNCASTIVSGFYNTTLEMCTNGSATGGTLAGITPTTTTWVTANFITGAFGSTGGGLASWTIIIVTVIVGSILIGLISGAFGRGRQ